VAVVLTIISMGIAAIGLAVLDEMLGETQAPWRALVTSKRFTPGSPQAFTWVPTLYGYLSIADVYEVELHGISDPNCTLNVLVSRGFYDRAIPGMEVEVIFTRGRFSKRRWVKNLKEAQ